MNLGNNFIAVECSGQLPIGYLKYPDDNTAQKIYLEKLTWEDARVRCISDGADLAVAITPQKIKHIQIRSGATGMDTWIGIYRPLGTSNWVRVDTGTFRPNPVVHNTISNKL